MRRPRLLARSLSLMLVVALAVSACGNSNKTPVPSHGVLGATSAPGASAGGGASNGVGGGSSSGTESSASSATGSGGSPSGPTAPPSTAPGADAGSVALQNQFVAVIKRVKPAVVLIETSQGLGSGVIFDGQGDIVTNAHVAGNATSFKVSLSDGHSYPGTLVGSFAPDDIAVIRIKASGLTPAVFGDSSRLEVGDVVLAMGNPLGLQSSVTEGIVSALGRTVSEPGGNALPDVIQTSAAINPGNSGGALVDLEGQVVGIPTLAATDPQLGGAAAGIGFAISSNRARSIATQLIGTGHVTASGRAFLGVTLADTNGQGALVYSVQPNGPAAKAGIAAGDVITSVGGQPTPDSATLVTILAQQHPGLAVKVAILRQTGSTATLTVTLGQMPG